MQSLSLSFTQSHPTPITPPAKLRRQERKASQLSYERAMALLGGRLQARDIDILKAVWTMGLMTADQIRRLLFYRHASVKSAQNVMRRRLRILYDEYCLERFYFSLNSDAVYRLDTQGARILQASTGTKISISRKQAARQFFLLAHTLGVAEFAVSLTEAARTQGGDLAWVGETTLSLKMGRDDYFEPDGAGLLRLQKQRPYLFFLEWDRNTEPQSEFIKKMRRYRRYQLTQDWQRSLRGMFPGIKVVSFPPMVIVTTGGKRRMANILTTVSNRLKQMQIDPRKQPVFATTQELLIRKGILDAPFFQAGVSTKDDLIWDNGKRLIDAR